MCLWTRGVYPQTLYDKLNTLVKFIIQVYAVSWFEIKTDNNFFNQQLYIFNMIQRTKQQSTEIQNTVFNSLKYSAFALVPENILISMINSDGLDVREEAIKKILSIRDSGPPQKRLKKITAINFAATHWSNLIDLSQTGVCEPALTECFTNEELEKVERVVKLTTEASQVVYGRKQDIDTLLQSHCATKLGLHFPQKEITQNNLVLL